MAFLQGQIQRCALQLCLLQFLEQGRLFGSHSLWVCSAWQERLVSDFLETVINQQQQQQQQ